MTLVARRALGLVTVQDLGRPGRMHEAVPPGGALVRERLVAANRAAGNPDGAAAIEVLGTLVVRAEDACVVATDTTGATTLPVGAELTVTSEPRRVAYLALRGGIAAPLLLGGRGALLCAGLGGLVRAGQVLASAELPRVAPAAPTLASTDASTRAHASASPSAEMPTDAPIRLLAGPDGEHFLPGTLALLTSSTYRILPSSNRVGTRLDGPALPRSAVADVSRPMVIGALEVPGDGKPIVLGPEHPTTGGYPIVAVVARADLGRLFSIRLGGSVRFTLA